MRSKERYQDVDDGRRVEVCPPEGEEPGCADVHGDEGEDDPEDDGGLGHEEDTHSDQGQDGSPQ